MPNILKEYNPKLVGYSLGDGLSFEWPAQFNVAEGGAMTKDMPFMAAQLIRRITNDSRVDVANHWKVVKCDFFLKIVIWCHYQLGNY